MEKEIVATSKAPQAIGPYSQGIIEIDPQDTRAWRHES